MSKFLKLYLFSFLLVLCVLILFSAGFLLKNETKQAHAAVAKSLGNYAWSSTIGWIDMSRVVINDDNSVTGYAWSSNIGWIKFGGLSGFPTGGGTSAVNATFSGGSFSGWARACAGMDNPPSVNQTTPNNTCTGTTRTDGWDGWISLNGTGYGVSVSASAVSGISNAYYLSGYSWGSDVVGWIFWNSAYVVDGVTTCNQTGTCPPGGGNITSASASPDCASILVSWATATGTTTSYSLVKNGASPAIYSGPATAYTDSAITKGVTYSYVVTPYNGGFAGSSSVAVTASVPTGCVSGGTRPEIGTFVASPTSVPKNSSCSLNWTGVTGISGTSSPTNRCVITGPSMNYIVPSTGIPAGSTSTPAIQATSKYTMTCTNSTGTVTKSATCALKPGYIEF